VRRARRITFFPQSSDLGPLSFDRERAVKLIEDLRATRELVVLTARYEGSDLVIRTIEVPLDPVAPAAEASVR